MIKTDVLFDNIDDISCAWVPVDADVPELAKISDSVIEKNMQYLSLSMGAVGTVWAWMENKPVRILARVGLADDKRSDVAISELATNVTNAFRHGASGVQVFIHYDSLEDFVNMMLPVRDDLFFERYFSIAINIDEVPSNDWEHFFALLKKIRPNSVLILADGEKFNPKYDFLGRAYAMLGEWDLDFALHIMFGKNMMWVSQMLRLVQKMQPKLVQDLRVFIVPAQE